MLRRIITAFTYILATGVVVIGTIVLVAYGTGYSYDFKDHQVIFNGLVMITSAPSGAAVTLNGKDIKKTTPYRATLRAGSYAFTVSRAGYRPWAKVLPSVAYQVTQAQYVMLFPNTLKLSTETTNLSGSILTADDQTQQHMAYLTGGATPAVWSVDTGLNRRTRIYTAKVATPDQPAEQVQSLTWSADSSHVLIKSIIGTQTYFNLVGADGKSDINITNLFGFDFTDLQMSPNNWSQLYWISPEGLRKIDVNAQTVSAVIADNVSAYTFGDGRIFYAQSTPLGESLWAIDQSGHKQEVIQSLAVSPSYDLDFVQYQGEDLLAVLPSATRTVTLYEDVLSAHQTARVISESADEIAFSQNGRFLTYYSGTSIGTYDIQQTMMAATEKPVIYTFSSGGSQLEALNWFDNYHLLVNVDGRLVVMEYDGSNRTDLVAAAPGSLGYLTNSQHQLWYIKPTSVPLVGQLEIAELNQ